MSHQARSQPRTPIRPCFDKRRLARFRSCDLWPWLPPCVKKRAHRAAQADYPALNLTELVRTLNPAGGKYLYLPRSPITEGTDQLKRKTVRWRSPRSTESTVGACILPAWPNLRSGDQFGCRRSADLEFPWHLPRSEGMGTTCCEVVIHQQRRPC